MSHRQCYSARLSLLGVATCLAAACFARPAHAVDFQLHVEPAVALWLDEPQADRFAPGFYGAIRPGIALGSVVNLQWSYALLAVPAGDGWADSGAAHFFTTGIRLRPLAPLQSEDKQLGGLFIDGNVGYVRTGLLDRLGLDVGVGYGIQFLPWMSIAPVARYVHIIQPDRLASADPNDAQLITLGLDFGFGPARRQEPVEEDEEDEEDIERSPCPDEVVCPEPVPVSIVVADPADCRDSDHDGVCDDYDRCPDRIGPLTTLGCPIDPCSGEPLVVLVQFDYDSTSMPKARSEGPQTMDPVLDSVAKAMAQDPSCRVCIMGYASEEGPSEYNMELSQRRATAVERYLHGRGLASNRMPTTGMGEACQIVPAESMELNRRVEFRRLEEGQSCPTDCSN